MLEPRVAAAERQFASGRGEEPGEETRPLTTLSARPFRAGETLARASGELGLVHEGLSEFGQRLAGEELDRHAVGRERAGELRSVE